MPPLTGLVKIYGPEIVHAAQIACEEINQRGGVLGRQLELIIEDDGSMPDTAVPAAERLINQHGCVALIGNLLSNSRIAVVAQVAEPKQIPLLNFSFYEGSIRSHYFFHFAALPNQQIDKMIPWMADRFGLKMFFAGNNYEWPRGSIDAAKRALQSLNGDILGEEYFDIGVDPAEIDRLLDQVMRSGADVFVPYFAGSDQMTLLTRFTELGMKSRMAVVMGHYDEMMVSQLPPHVREGFYSSNTYFMSLHTPENQHYLQRLARHPGIAGLWPNGNGVLTNFGEGTYLCVHAFANAVEAAGSTESAALTAALEKVCLIGPQGFVEMDAETHHAHVNTYLARCNAAGMFDIIEHFGRIAPRIPPRYIDHSRTVRIHTPPLTKTINPTLAPFSSAQQILSIADMSVIATNAQGIITDANRSTCLMFGYREDELIGMSVHLLLPPHFRQRHAELLQQFIDSAETERRMKGRGEVMGYRKDGTFFPLEASIAKFRNAGTWSLVVTMRDIADRKKAEDELTRQATHDALTGLPNRVLIRERLDAALLRSRRNGSNIALLFVDLDGFKLINDTHGHAAGDSLLKEVATRLIEQVRPGDTVARLAGDEFVILCEQVEQPTSMSVLAERLNDSLRLPYDFNALSLFVSASIGIAIGNGSTHSTDDLLRYADTAMYAAKEKGRDGWQFFSESLQQQAKQRLAITNGLRTAIERNEFSPRFQPIVAAESSHIVGAELLLRWHPAEGEISPAIFIPIAELTGSIVAIGAWVFRQACLAEADWRQRWGDAAPYVSVNVSTRQLSEATLVEDFAALLHETGADPTRLLLEITETSLMADVEANLHVLRRLADLGLRVAVDDFGTGYSSLAQLSRLPVNVLKIDRAFVEGIEKNAESRTIIRAVIGLGRALGLKLVAEGVENNAQRRELRALGCDYIQGYLFHRPLEQAAFIETFTRAAQSTRHEKLAPLYMLIYVSQATHAMSPAALEELTKAARSANKKSGITGCLLYQDGYFMQMLEGSREYVQGLISKISHDARHSQFRIVFEGPCLHRHYHDWGMMLHELTGGPLEAALSRFQQRKINFLELADDPKACYALITAFACNNTFE